MKTIKTKFNFIVWVGVLGLLLSACSKSKGTWVQNERPPDQVVRESVEKGEVRFEPKAEVIFLMDISGSMPKHIANVFNNIDIFVKGFAQNNPMEYNVAVVSVYDSRRFSSEKYQQKFGHTDAFVPLGQFRQVKKSASEYVPNKYFISSKDENVSELLQNTLKLPVQGTDKGGPEVEEIFSPIAAIYGLGGYSVPESIRERQAGFFMGKDSYKIIFIVTDSKDGSIGLTASDLYQQLVAASGNDRSKVMAFAAIVPSDSKGCAYDPALLTVMKGHEPHNIETFVGLTTRSGNKKSQIVSLCEPFGAKFAEFGRSVRARTLNLVVSLKSEVPVMKTESTDPNDVCLYSQEGRYKTYDRLHVCYGEQEIPFEVSNDIVGFRYNQRNNTIRINPDFPFQVQQVAKIRLLYTAINPRLAAKGQVKRFGVMEAESK